jgi:hypothetical protein
MDFPGIPARKGSRFVGSQARSRADFKRGLRKPEFARTLNPSLQDFKTWLRDNKAAIPLEETTATA